MKTIVVIISTVILLAYIYLLWPYVRYSNENRLLKQLCSKDKVCYLEDAFPVDLLPTEPVVIFEYYHRQHFTEEVLEQMDILAKRYNIPYKVVNRRYAIRYYPPDVNQPKIVFRTQESRDWSEQSINYGLESQ